MDGDGGGMVKEAIGKLIWRFEDSSRETSEMQSAAAVVVVN